MLTYTNPEAPCQLGCFHNLRICACGCMADFKSIKGHYYCRSCYREVISRSIPTPIDMNFLECFLFAAYRKAVATIWLKRQQTLETKYVHWNGKTLY